MTSHPNRNRQGRTDIHYWMLKEGAYGAGARYIGTDRGKAKEAAEAFSDEIRDSVELYEASAGDFDKYGAARVLTYDRFKAGGRWVRKGPD